MSIAQPQPSHRLTVQVSSCCRRASDEAAVFEDIVDESEHLFGEDAPALATTLLACPDVEAWRDDFTAFDRFVTTAEATLRDGPMGLSLVAFHPSFARWRQLPQEVLASLDENAMSGGGGGTEVWAHFEEAYSDTPYGTGESSGAGEVLHRRSAAPERAVVIDDDETSVGVRKVAM